MLCVWPDGRITSPSGQEVAHASLSARQVRDLGLLTSGISGRHSSGSSRTALLRSSLVSKFRGLMVSHGSMLYSLTLKKSFTPSQVLIYALRASGRRTNDKGFIGWPTPTASDGKGCGSVRYAMKKIQGEKRPSGNSWQTSLRDYVHLAGWPTPTASNAKTATQDAEKVIARMLKGKQSNLQDFASLAGWPTPTASSSKGGYQGGRIRNGKLSTDRLDYVAQISGPIRMTATGEMLTGCSAEMVSGGQLNPAHSRWLMGYPEEWDELAPTGTR